MTAVPRSPDRTTCCYGAVSYTHLLLTPEGLGAKLRLTRNYLARKEEEYVAMKVEIERMRAELAAQDDQGKETKH